MNETHTTAHSTEDRLRSEIEDLKRQLRPPSTPARPPTAALRRHAS